MADNSPSAVALLMAWLEDRLEEIKFKQSQIGQEERRAGIEFNQFQPSVGVRWKLYADREFFEEQLRALKADHPTVEADFATTQKDVRIGDEDYSDEIDPESTDPSMLDFAVSLLRRTARSAPPIESDDGTYIGDHYDQSKNNLLSRLKEFLEDTESGREDLENKLREGQDFIAVKEANEEWFRRQLILDTFNRVLGSCPNESATVMALLNGSDFCALDFPGNGELKILARRVLGEKLEEWFAGLRFVVPSQRSVSETIERSHDPQKYIFELSRASSVDLHQICHGIRLVIDGFADQQNDHDNDAVSVVTFLVAIVEKGVRDRTRQFTSDEAWTAIVALRCACIITIPPNVLSSLLIDVLYWSKDVAKATLEIHSQLDRLCTYTESGPFDCTPEMHKHIGKFPPTRIAIQLSSLYGGIEYVYVRPWGLLVRYGKEIDVQVAHEDMVIEIGHAVTVRMKHEKLVGKRKFELSQLAELLTKFPRATIKPVQGQ